MLAQALLEIVRIDVANKTGKWIFSRVSPAGIRVKTASNFTQPSNPGEMLQPEGQGPEYDTLDAPLSSIIPRWPYLQEFQCILSRMSKWQSRAIEAAHFSTYDHILCFSQEDHDALKILQSKVPEALRKAAIICLLMTLDAGFQENMARMSAGLSGFIWQSLGISVQLNLPLMVRLVFIQFWRLRTRQIIVSTKRITDVPNNVKIVLYWMV